MTAHQPPKDARAPLSEFPVSDKCLGETPHFEDAPAWIYNHDNPYLHGVYAPTTRELNQDKLEVIGEVPNGFTRHLLPKWRQPLF
jgi:carotenoid cleavage dioxygenase